MNNNESRVLLVNDSDESTMMLKDMFSSLNVNTDIAKGSEEAMNKMIAHDYKLVIADSRMEDKSGIELLKQIRSDHPETRVAMLSLYNTAHTLRMVITDKIDYYLPKPVKLKHLKDMISSLALEL